MTDALPPRFLRAAERMQSPWLASDARAAAARVFVEAPPDVIPAALVDKARAVLAELDGRGTKSSR
jgi:hypothetical protein